MLSYVFWDPSKAIMNWNIPFLGRPIMWYGFFFALGFFLAYLIAQVLFQEFLRPYGVGKKEANKIVEKLSYFVVVGAILGARLVDVFFYQSLASFQGDLLGIVKFWEGGLSSHGGVIGILMGLWIFSSYSKKKYPMLTWVALLDLLCIPALLAGAFIRIGNFFNQEIIGTQTLMPWGVIFAHPADGASILPRHPVQLYEAVFYLLFFAVMWTLRYRIPKIYRLGKTAGLFFMGTFVFRFFIEFVKNPQSALIAEGGMLDMGQYLSIPLVLFGAILFFREKNGLRARSMKGD
jgi:phosphatidylglycerol:prolipoprotein diacylglycerol transferase